MSASKYKFALSIPADTAGWGENKRTLPALAGKVEVSVDWDALVQHFGKKALRSKGKKTGMLHGMIKVKVLEAREL